MIGCAVLWGWSVGSAPLVTGGFPARAATTPLTAVALVLAAASLWARSARPGRGSRIAVYLCAALLAGLGLAMLLEYSGPRLFSEQTAAMDPSSRERVPVLAACELVALGGLFLLWDVRVFRRYWVVHLLIPVTALAPLQAVLGYAYRVPSLSDPAAATALAVPTVVAFSLLVVGAAAARVPYGFLTLLTGAAPGPRVARRLLVGTMLVVPALGWLRLAGERNRWYSGEAGVVLNTLLMMAAIAALVLWATASLEQSGAVAQVLSGRLHMAEAQLAAVLEQMPVGVIIAEAPGGRLMAGNREMERLWGRPMLATGSGARYADWDGRHPDGRRYEPHEWPLARVIAHGEPVSNEEITIIAADGTTRTTVVSAAPVRAQDGRIVAGVVVTLDISERRRIEKEREALHARAEEALAEATRAARVKDEFLATLSHELRTPLNAILGWTHMLARGRLPADAMAHGLATIERNAHAQVRLIEDLLDLSRVISGTLRLDVAAVDPVSVIGRAIESVAPSARAKEIALEPRLDPAAGPVLADPHRLQQIAWNLLTNAVKFTPAGGRVVVRLERVDAQVSLTISDTGIGIRPDFLPHLFEPFRQQDGGMTRAHGGLGLGLSIVRELVQLQGGAIHAHSDGPGCGATFTVTFPVHAAVAQPYGQPARPPANIRLDGISVLVVDDDADNLGAVGTLLHTHGARVFAAPSASDALGLLVSVRPDVILADIAMPDQDGYELIAQVRELERARGMWTPAAAVTAHAGADDRARALMAGFQVHVPKPVNPSELVAVVANLAGRLDAPARENV